MSRQAREALESAEIIIGYKLYIDQVRRLLEGKTVLSSGMTRELDRAAAAIESALEGRRVALVSGGDPGIYAMAGVVFELARARNIAFGKGEKEIDIQVVPGIPALAAAAAVLGAPLTHDFASISLSDRLTPWELIEKRLALAAEADFVIVLYNPKSKGRDWQFEKACRIVSNHRSGNTPLGLVKKAMRDGQAMTLSTLDNAAQLDVDMQSIVIIGNSRTFTHEGRMITPRGYLDKYPDAAS